MRIKKILIFTVLLIMVGCRAGNLAQFKPDTLSKEDLCIFKTEDKKSKVCYGMKKAVAEKVLGDGQSRGLVSYDLGVSILYREDETVAMIRLAEESGNFYTTPRGVKVGTLKDDFIKLYGEKHKIMNDGSIIEYYYNVKEKEFIEKSSLRTINSEHSIDIILVSSAFDVDNVLRSIVLGDLLAGREFR